MSSYKTEEEGKSNGVMCFRVTPHLLRGVVVEVMMSEIMCGNFLNTRVCVCVCVCV